MDEIDFEREFGVKDDIKDKLYKKYLELRLLTDEKLKTALDMDELDINKMPESSDFKRGFEAGVKLMSLLIFK